MKICEFKTNYLYDQKTTFNLWIDKGLNLIKLKQDELIVFSTLYSALNCAAWIYSDATADRVMINDFQNKFYSYISLNFPSDLKQWRKTTNSITEYAQNAFYNMHKLQTRNNSSSGTIIKFKIGATEVKLSDIDANEVSDLESFLVSAGILYQYRCNLVHGTKSIGLNENIHLARLLNKKLAQTFASLPNELIHENNKKALAKFIQ